MAKMVPFCPQHKQTFSTRDSLIRHKKEVHQPIKRCNVPNCGYAARREATFRKHARSHWEPAAAAFYTQIPLPGAAYNYTTTVYQPPSFLDPHSMVSLPNTTNHLSHITQHQVSSNAINYIGYDGSLEVSQSMGIMSPLIQPFEQQQFVPAMIPTGQNVGYVYETPHIPTQPSDLTMDDEIPALHVELGELGSWSGPPPTFGPHAFGEDE